MLGLKNFVGIQTFRWRPFVPSHNFCHPAGREYFWFLFQYLTHQMPIAHFPLMVLYIISFVSLLQFGLALQKKATMEKQSNSDGSIDEDDGEGWGRTVFGRAWFDNEWGGGGPLAQEDFFPLTNSVRQSTGHMYQEVQTSKTQHNTYTQGILV